MFSIRAWISALKELRLTRVKNVNFSYISPHAEASELEDSQRFQGTDILIHFSRRDPFELLGGPDQGKLVVAMFAWDGNSYVGNEYWAGLLSASGDPADLLLYHIGAAQPGHQQHGERTELTSGHQGQGDH